MLQRLRSPLRALLAPAPILLTILLTALGTAAAQPDAPVRIEFWTIELARDFTDFLEESIDLYEEEHPDVDLVWRDVALVAFGEELARAMASGTGPDLVNVNVPLALEFAERGWLRDLSPLLDRSDEERYFDRLLGSFRIDGRQLALPWYLTTPVLFYDPQAFERALLDPDRPPATTADAHRVARALHERLDVPGLWPNVTEQQLLYRFLEAGLPVTDPAGERAAFDTAAHAAYLDERVRLFDEGVFPAELFEEGRSTPAAAFLEGRLPMVTAGVQLLGRLRAADPERYERIRVAPYPLGPGESIHTPLMGFAVTTGSAAPDEAVDLARFLTGDERQLAFARRTAVLPSSRGAAEDPYFRADGSAATPAERARHVAASQLPYARDLTMDLPNASALFRRFEEEIEHAFRRFQTPEEALHEAARFWNALLGAPSQGAPTRPDDGAATAPQAAETTWSAVSDAFVPGRTGTEIVPAPQELSRQGTSFLLSSRTDVVLHSDTPALREAAARVQQDVAVRHGFRPTIRTAAEASTSDVAIRVGILGDDGAPTTDAAPVDHPEGYVLEVDRTGVTILGADERGAFYGLQSLRQLLGPTSEVQGVTVRDWPTLPWRVAMVYLDANSDDVNGRLLPILAELKYNAVLIMSNYVHWESAPELHVPQGAPREAAERLAAVARANLLEPIPLLETLGHAEWFFANGANAELRGDPASPRPFVMDPLNPETYRRLLPILDEAVEIFEPRYVHIGHDEVRNVGTFPATPEARAIGFGRLFRDDVLRLYDHLARHGVGTMIWDDELVSDEVQPYWSDLPDDLVVTSWRYEAAGAYPLLELAHGAGFPTLGASWFERDNIDAMARAVRDLGAEGLVQTRWTGYFGNAAMMRGQYPQVYAYVTAAAAAWNPAADATLAAPAWFREAWLANRQGERRGGAVLDLSPLANQRVQGGPFGLDEGYALVELLRTQTHLGGVRYDLGPVVALRGTHPRARDLPQRVRIEVGRGARTLAFLHATGWYASEGEVVGGYEVVYADGSRVSVPLVYGRDIAAWVQRDVATIDLEQPWRGTTPNGLEVAAYALRWRNPNPHLSIDHVEFVSEGGIAAPMLLGLTLLD